MAFTPEQLARMNGETTDPRRQRAAPARRDAGTAPLTSCPSAGCPARGVDVYRADGHDVGCTWMQRIAPRCVEHDELLRPDETSCPAPGADEDADDPHRRRAS